MKKSVIMQLLVILLIAMIPVIGCGESDQVDLPNLKVGDQWVFRITSGESEHTMNVAVTGEDVVNGRDCYVFEVSVEPSFEGLIDLMTIKRDKATMEEITVQKSGEYMDTPYTISMIYSYIISGENPYPLELGKEYKEIVTMNSTTTIEGEDPETETEENTYIYKIEAIEEITVPAGTFECFKIVKYDEEGTNVIQESWASDEIKQYTVKKIDYASGKTTELKSYSLL